MIIKVNYIFGQGETIGNYRHLLTGIKPFAVCWVGLSLELENEIGVVSDLGRWWQKPVTA